MIRIGSLFSGYGGLDLAVQSVLGGEIAWHVEYDKAPSRILDHHFPGVPNYGDVTKLDFTSIEPVDVITGGYPCQPFSHAGLRKGTNDERHLWPHVLRAIREMGPRLAVLENVRGHLSLGFDVVLSDLASVGWSARWGVVRASDAGAPHQRARLFIVAYPQRQRHHGRGGPGAARPWRSGRAHVAGPADPFTDASSQRHGARKDAGRVGRLDSQDAGSARQRERARQVIGDRGPAATADACDCQQQIDQGHDSVHGERAQIGRGAVVTARARGNGVDTVGPLARTHAASRAAAACDRSPATDATGSGRVRAPQHEDDGADSGRGRRHDVADLGQGHCAAPADTSGEGRQGPAHGREERRSVLGPHSWGDYGPAIHRWESVIGRPAPAPTESGRTGAPRLSPAFVEWMMGLPPGWVTDPSIGISRNDQLKALGNGVVPQQAALALDVLLQGASDHLRQSLATV